MYKTKGPDRQKVWTNVRQNSSAFVVGFGFLANRGNIAG
jgi:hypothetical protein